MVWLTLCLLRKVETNFDVGEGVTNLLDRLERKDVS
jgi:hypothetical protein